MAKREVWRGSPPSGIEEVNRGGGVGSPPPGIEIEVNGDSGGVSPPRGVEIMVDRWVLPPAGVEMGMNEGEGRGGDAPPHRHL